MLAGLEVREVEAVHTHAARSNGSSHIELSHGEEERSTTAYDPRGARPVFRAEEELRLCYVEVLLEMGALSEAECELRSLSGLTTRSPSEASLRSLRRKLSILRGDGPADDEVSPLARAARDYVASVAKRLHAENGQPEMVRQPIELVAPSKVPYDEVADEDGLSLLQICEREGDVSRLEQTAQICRYVAKDSRPATLGRLAGLCKALGNEPLQKAMERRFLDAFRKEFCRPSFNAVLRVAGWRYLPLDQLQKIHFPSTELTIERTRRERAIGFAMRGQYGRAREIFMAEDRPLDRRYLADLLLLEGHTQRAIDLYVHTYPVEANDTWTLMRLLSLHAENPSSAIVDLFRRYGIRERALDLLDQAIVASPDDPMLWKALGTLHTILGHRHRAESCAERVVSLTSPAWESNTVGRTFTALHGVDGHASGCVERVQALRQPAAAPQTGGSLVATTIAGHAAGEGTSDLLDTFKVAKLYAKEHFPAVTGDIDDYDYELRIDGAAAPSLGLAEVIAFLSVFLQKPVVENVAFSGVVVHETDDHAHLDPTEAAEHAVVGAYERNLRFIVVPEGNRAEMSDSVLVPSWVARETVRYARNLDGAVTIAFGEEIRPN